MQGHDNITDAADAGADVPVLRRAPAGREIEGVTLHGGQYAEGKGDQRDMIWYMAGSPMTDTKALSVYFEPVDGDMDKVVLKDQSVDIGIWPIPGACQWKSGRHVEEAFVPKAAILVHGRSGGGPKKGEATLPDFIEAHLAQIVSERMKDMIEARDPGVHQFLPVTLRYRSGGTVPVNYFWFAPGARVFAVNAEKTEPPLKPYKPTSSPVNPHSDREPMRRPPMPPKDMHPVFHAEKVGSFDLFCDGEFRDVILVTDRLKLDFEAGGLSGCTFYGPHPAI